MTGPCLDRASIEMVLRRASEIRERIPEPDEVGLTSNDLVEIAREVGVSPQAVVTALAEHQAGAPTRRGVADRLIGPRVVWASRLTASDEATARESSIDWLATEHGLRTRVRDDGVVVARKRTDVVGKLAGGVRRARGRGGLGRFREVQVASVAGDDQPAAVCLVVDVGNKRNEAMATGAVVTAGGAAFVGFVALIAGPVTLAALPLVAGAGAVTSRRSHRATVRRAADDVEETLDRIASGAAPRRWRDPLSR